MRSATVSSSEAMPLNCADMQEQRSCSFAYNTASRVLWLAETTSSGQLRNLLDEPAKVIGKSLSSR